MNVAMIGAGYVGLTTGTCLAMLGHSVRCHDVDGERLGTLLRGELPIYEPGLKEAFTSARSSGGLQFCRSIEDCVGAAEVVFLAVGTPSREDGEIDLTYLETAARQIAPHLAPDATVVVKSTVCIGTSRHLRSLIADSRGSSDFRVASNPEFLREGSAMHDFLHPDRIVIGADEPETTAIVAALYRPLLERETPLLLTTTENAELVKHAANAFLALKIGFINEVADLCERSGADVGVVADGVGLDRRIGRAFLQAGPGFGGSCFPKDTRAFVAVGRRHGAPQRLIETLIQRNEDRKLALARRIVNASRLRPGSTVAVLGVAFKARTDDVRDSAALTVIPALQQKSMVVRAHDPQAMQQGARQLRDVDWCRDAYHAAAGADAVVVLTEWEEYRKLDLVRLARSMSGTLLFDYRNLFEPEKVLASGLDYVGVGRPPRHVTSSHGKSRLAAAAF